MSQYSDAGFNPYEPQGGDPPKTSLLAVSGFVSSVIICCPLTSLIGLLLGVGGLVSVSSSNGRRKGTGLAAAAVAISLLSLAGQAILLKVGWPHIQSYIDVGVFIATGPTEFIQDLEAGDIASARTHLYPSFDATVTDEQLLSFGAQVKARYGTALQWMPPTGQSLNVTGPGENPTDFTGSVQFTNGTQPVSVRLTVLVGQNGLFEQYGIAELTIRDTALGDLTLDASTPVIELPPGEPTEPANEEPGSGEGGG